MWLSLALAAEPVQTVDLSVMSWNVWGLHWPLSLDRDERMAEIPAELDRADLVGLQEVWGGALRRLDADLTMPMDQPGDSGLAIGGRLGGSTSAALFHPFAIQTGIERFKQKGILETEVLVEGIAVRVYNTHLQHGPDSAGVRAEQAGQLIALLAQHDQPSVVLGDFNFYRNHPTDTDTIAQMNEAGLRDVAEELERPQATFRFDNRYALRSGLEEGRERFDRVYVRNGSEVQVDPVRVEVVRYQRRPLSDHQPLLTQLQLRR